jgi:carboxyl-terminal processing protease
MLPASNRGPGQALGFPDVCLTPAAPSPVPVPYPNIGMNAQAAPFATSVKVNMMNALNMVSQVPMTSGDEAGSAHPMVKGPERFTTGSPNVFVEGMPAITLTSLTTHNNMNCPVGAVIVPSAVNVMFSRVADDGDYASGRSLSLADLRELGGAARATSVSAAVLEGDAAHVKIEIFSLSAGCELSSALERVTAGGATRAVIDVRGVRGGTIEGAVFALSQLLPAGCLLAELEEPDGDRRALRSSGGGFLELPLVVLVDGGTASAAELFAGVLSALGRAVLVGEKTFGKGVSQRVSVGAAGEVVRAQSARILLPGNVELDGVGLSPRG